MNWNPIPNHPEYEVSDDGQVRSLKGDTPKILKPLLTGFKRRYSYVCLYTNDKQHTVAIHALVAAAFIGPRPEGMVVRHINGDASNNAATNLAYGTPSENERDKRGHGTLPLSDDQVRTIRLLKEDGWPVLYLMKLFHKSRAAIYNILNRKSYGWVT